MKLKMQLMAAAVALAAASGANAALNNGAGGNGELFLNVWDGTGSYSFDLNTTIDAFQSSITNAGAINQSYALTNFGSFLSGVANTSALKFNLLASDTSGARRLLTTFTPPTASPTKDNGVIRSAASNVTTFAGNVSTAMGSNDYASVGSASAAYAGSASMGNRISGLLNFDTVGSLANNSYATGLSFMRIDAAATGVANSAYSPYVDGSSVHVWIDGTNTLHIAAVPEPSEYALMLAGLGMLGFIARRRLDKRV